MVVTMGELDISPVGEIIIVMDEVGAIVIAVLDFVTVGILVCLVNVIKVDLVWLCDSLDSLGATSGVGVTSKLVCIVC